MKKILIFFLVLTLSFVLFSCGEAEEVITDPYFKDYQGTIYDTDNFTNVDSQNLTGQYNLSKNPQQGVIFHAWNWSYNEIKKNLPSIAAAGFSTVQTSPVQQPKEYSTTINEVADCWWKLYQPISFSVARNSWLGTKAELTSLCTEAKKIGVKVIVDIVANHLAGGSSTSMNVAVRQYEQEIYDDNLIHTDYEKYTKSGIDADLRSVAAEVVTPLGDYPDLQTENPKVQARVISLLKECLDCGVYGFRFDAAKHIANSTDGALSSNFWDNVLSTTTNYANSTYSFTPYYYGEILNDLYTTRNMSTYTDLMSVTDNGYSGQIANFVATNTKVDPTALMSVINSNYAKTSDASKVVLWAESHDTFADGALNGDAKYNPVIYNATYINKVWSIVGARKDATALYFAQPQYNSEETMMLSKMGEMGSTAFMNNEVVQINKFHNLFIGADEKFTYQSGCLVNERSRKSDGKVGLVITPFQSKTNAFIKDIETTLADGCYIDQIGGNRFVVKDGKLMGTLNGQTAVIYQTSKTTVKPLSTVKYSISTTKFYEGTSPLVTVTTAGNNITKLTYQVDGGAETEVKNNQFQVNKECHVVLKGYNGTALSAQSEFDIDNFEYIKKKEGYQAFCGVSANYIQNYNIYAWQWNSSKQTTYSEVLIENGVVYVKEISGYNGVLLVVYNKDKTLDKFANIHMWESGMITQTADFEFSKTVVHNAALY